MLIDWNKPKKVRPTKDHNTTFSSDSGVDGTFVPNMSKKDMVAWKGKHINKGKDHARIELRKTFEGTQLLIILAKDGWDFKHESRTPDSWGRSTLGKNVRISMNGPLILTFAEMEEIQDVITEAKIELGEIRI